MPLSFHSVGEAGISRVIHDKTDIVRLLDDLELERDIVTVFLDAAIGDSRDLWLLRPELALLLVDQEVGVVHREHHLDFDFLSTLALELILHLEPWSGSSRGRVVVTVEVHRPHEVILFDLEQDVSELVFLFLVTLEHEKVFELGFRGVKVVLVNIPVAFDAVLVENCGRQNALQAL